MASGFWNQVKGNWKQFVGAAQEKWGKITENELAEIRGDRKQLIGKVQERYGIAKQEAEREVDDWADRMNYKMNNT